MAKTQIDFMPIFLAAGAYLVYKAGLLDPLLVKFGLPPTRPPGTLPPGTPPPTVITEDQAALIVIRNQPGLCDTMSALSNGSYNCNTDANKILLVRQWFYSTDPSLVPLYGTLVNYVKAKGWASK